MHSTGQRVPKIRSKMADHELQMQEVNICSDIEDLFDSYQLDDGIKTGLTNFSRKSGVLNKNIVEFTQA